jgi:hypothetical protein
MNDKIGISIVDFEENKSIVAQYFSNKHLEYIGSNANLSVDELSKFKEMYSKQVFYADDTFSAFKDSRGLRIDFNPNKILDVKPCTQIEHKELQQSISIVETHLKSIGIDCNVNNAKVYKYHQCFDIEPHKPYKSYLPMILTLKPKREIRKSEKKIIENSFYMQNKTQIVSIYDKSKESNLDYNCIRFEHRINKMPKQDKFLLGSLNDDYFRYIRQNSYRIIKDTIFTYADDAIEKELNLSALCLNLVNADYKANDIMKIIFANSVNADLQARSISENELFKSVKSRNSDDTRNAQYNQVIALKKILNSFKMLDVSTLEPYKELKEYYYKIRA